MNHQVKRQLIDLLNDAATTAQELTGKVTTTLLKSVVAEFEEFYPEECAVALGTAVTLYMIDIRYANGCTH